MGRIAKQAAISSLFVIVLSAVRPAAGLDHLALSRNGETLRLDGRTMIVAQDKSCMFQTRDGVVWLVKADEVVEMSSDEAPFVPYTSQELAGRLLAELPAGFDVYYTANYVICHNTSRGYAQWCGALLERLHMAFTNFWSRKGFDLNEPEFPLVACVFADKGSYSRFALPELGEAVNSVVAYYSLRTNRITMYDLSGIESSGGPPSRMNSAVQINRILSQPSAAPMVATIVHEATHQIAFNCGLHQRYSDCPTWFSEGIAMYFETPDLNSSRGWRSIGQVNSLRLSQFRDYQRRRPSDSLQKLVTDDNRLRDTATAIDAYAEAWAVTYFLLQQKPNDYVKYLRTLSQKAPQFWDTPETRWSEFRDAFGPDLRRLEDEFQRYMSKVR
jgi:hypothetical protein